MGQRMVLDEVMAALQKSRSTRRIDTPQLSRLDYIATQIYTTYLTVSNGTSTVHATCEQAVYEAQALIAAIAKAEGNAL